MLYPSQAYNMYINSVLLFFWQPTVQHGVALQKKTCKTWRCINCWSPFTLANARIKIKTTPWLGTSTAHRDLLVHAKEKQVRNNKNIKRWSRESEHSLLGNGKKNIVSYKFLLKCDAGEWPLLPIEYRKSSEMFLPLAVSVCFFLFRFKVQQLSLFCTEQSI